MSGNGFKASLPDHVLDAFTVLRTSAEAGRLAHGYIISSVRKEWGLGLSVLMLQWLYCQDDQRPCGQCRVCRQIESRVHPDVIWLEPESKSRVIKIEQVRDLNAFIHQTSYEGGWKACVLLDADRLHENAANAFLKTLEEPPQRSLLLLVTESAQSLMPTIVSRCQRVHIGETADLVATSKIETAMLEWLRGRTPRTHGILQSAWINAMLSEIRTAAEIEEKNTDEDVDTEMLKARIQSRAIEARLEILRTLYKWERDLLVCVNQGDKKLLHFPHEFDILLRQSNGLSLSESLKRLDRIEQAARLLERNVPEASVWEAVLPV
jgi:DNA polymerase III subunit delta'